MTVAHVFAQAYVCHDKKFGPAALEQPYGLLHDAIIGVGAAGFFVLGGGNAEKNDRMQACIHGLLHLFFQLAEAQLVLAGHGADFFAKTGVFGFNHKIGLNKVFHEKGRSFAHQGAKFGGGTQTAAAMERSHGSILVFQARLPLS